MTSPDTSSASLYCACMEDVKARIALIRTIVAGQTSLGNEALDGEVLCLQLRRILEQVAFGSLLAHREVYEKAHKDLERIWRAKTLLDRLSKIHPEFYPYPVFESSERPMGARHFEPLLRGFLTTDDFVFLYDTASQGIHTWNPFKQGERIINFERSISEWVDRIEGLLWQHMVRFVGNNQVWLVQMNNSADNKVHAYIVSAV